MTNTPLNSSGKRQEDNPGEGRTEQKVGNDVMRTGQATRNEEGKKSIDEYVVRVKIWQEVLSKSFGEVL